MATTTPSKAQIEAVAWLVCPNETIRCQKLCGRCLVKARKILAAAAEVGEQKVVFQSMPDGSTAVLEHAIAAAIRALKE